MRAELALPALLCIAALSCGCVERVMVVRSEPPGAPVWVDRRYVGKTPLEYRFSHYGARLVRVGPLRDANRKLERLEQERVVELAAPWYEYVPLDFLAEVLWPFRLVDRHEPAPFALPPAEEQPGRHGEAAAGRILERAGRMRGEALGRDESPQGP